ncbi:MAG: inositol-3-phosphate synthase [Bacteroidota bacterium]
MIKLAIIGVGNCASSFLQGIEYYKDKSHTTGFIAEKIFGYEIGDIEITGAIDIDKRKVGKDISEAIFTDPNCAIKFSDVPKTGVKVVKGEVYDGVADHMHDSFMVDENQKSVDVTEYLKSTGADFAICYLPVGSEKAVRFYAQKALDAGIGFINAMPVFVCSTEEWSKKFADAGLVCIGDDIKAQIGATYTNRILVESLLKRGIEIDNMYQLNVGGNTDFENMIDESRLINKRVSKTSAVSSLFGDKKVPPIRIGPSDYIPHLNDTKICYININGRQFGDQKIEIELKLKVEDSPNSAGIMIDVVRLAKGAKDKGMKGEVSIISSFGFKHPNKTMPEDQIYPLLQDFMNS